MAGTITSPGRFLTFVPSDTLSLPFVPNRIWVGTAGDMVIYDKEGNGPTTLKSLTVGWHSMRITRILDTGTTATEVVLAS